ncbi:hypothetical protein M3914_003101 [Vibrio metschnikovii]|nr:hypothetical protein [Vibrio metschnikovii]
MKKIPSIQRVISYLQDSEIELAFDEFSRIPEADINKKFAFNLLKIIRDLDLETHEAYQDKGRAIALAVSLNTEKLQVQNAELEKEIAQLKSMMHELAVKYGPKPEKPESSYNEYLYQT